MSKHKEFVCEKFIFINSYGMKIEEPISVSLTADQPDATKLSTTEDPALGRRPTVDNNATPSTQ